MERSLSSIEKKFSSYEKRHMGMKTKQTIINTIVYIILILMAIIWLFPFFGIVMDSFRCESQGPAGYIIPQQFGFDNYVKLLNEDPQQLIIFGQPLTYTDGTPILIGKYLIWYKNTITMGIFVAVIQTFMVLSMSYTLSRLRFRGRKFLMNFMLVLGMFPGFLTMIVLYYELSTFFGLSASGQVLTGPNAPWGLILVYVASSGMGYYVSKGFFDTIPKSLDEAARVDGANRLQVMFKVILPLSKPIIIYTILTAFMVPWGDFMFAKYIANNSAQGMNVAVGLYGWTTKSLYGTNWTMFCAGGVLIAIPITILFMCLQRYYVEGVTGGAVKG